MLIKDRVLKGERELVKPGEHFESFIHYVYSSIINLEDRNTLVSKNAVIVGRSGAKHEFDVYYEFTKANVRHRVAIECKDHKKPISKGKVTEFYGKISDIDNIAGVMITNAGYQSGAKEFATHYGISILTIDDLPSLPQILSLQIKKAFLPDESIIGEPFWTLMESRNGDVTGTYTCVPLDSKLNKKIIPLFYSKRIANRFLSLMRDKNSVVRGVNQQQLKALITFLENLNVDNVEFAIFPLDSQNDHEWLPIPVTIEDLRKDFLLL
ncbi:hypothetical protein C2H98_15885 [Niallia circulans]|nr:hypothetical protein C2H98_15885 [Niallia circulans]